MSNCNFETMDPSSPDEEWMALRKQHETELNNWLRSVEADRQEFQRRIDARKARLLAKHKQEEGSYWRRHDQRTLTIPHPVASKVHPKTSKSSADPICASGLGPLPSQEPTRKQSWFKAFNSQNQSCKATKTTPAVQYHAEQSPKQSPRSQQDQQRGKSASIGSTGGAQPPKPGQTKPKATTSRTKSTPKKESQVIDLCSSDDDILVEVSKTLYQKTAAPTTVPAPYHLCIPSATLQHFGESDQKHFPISGPSSVKQEKRDVTCPVHAEDVPLDKYCTGVSSRIRSVVINTMTAPLNLDTALKKPGMTGSKGKALNVCAFTPELAKRSGFNKDVETTHLPSPSPSLASAPPTPTAHEGERLLNSFKKPTLPTTSRYPPDTRVQTVGSQASSCTLAESPALEQRTTTHRQASVASHTSAFSTLSRKRKQVDLSDDEQSDNSPSRASSATTRKESITSLGSSLETSTSSTQSLVKSKQLRPPPLPPTSPLSSAAKNKNGSGYRTKAMPASVSTPATPPRTSTIRSKPTTPVTPTPGFSDAGDEAFSTPPSKRKAAICAKPEIQKIREEEERFIREDGILQAAAREVRWNKSSTTELDTRLRSLSTVPRGARSRTARDVTVLDALTPADHLIRAAVNEEAANTTKSFSRGRATENRRAARTRNISRIIGDDSDEDLDISKFTYINGIIIQVGQKGRLTEMQTEIVRKVELSSNL